MLKEFNNNVVQQFRAKVRTSTRDEQENIITHFIKENSTKNTNELSTVVYDGTYKIFPKPKDAVKKMKEQLDKM